MASFVLYDRDFSREVNQGTLQLENFDHYFLCEGDSWMDRSSPAQLSLPWALANSFRGPQGDRALFINLSQFGHTMRQIGDCLNDVFHQWLTTPLGVRFDALLFSAGGNDFIDAALIPPPGEGILVNVRGRNPNRLRSEDCVDAAAVAAMVAGMDEDFRRLHDAVRASPLHGDIPILLNSYNAPVARDAPAVPGRRAWLAEAYRKNGIPRRLWNEVTERIFIDVKFTVTGWLEEDGREGLFVVPTDAVPLVPADPDATGSSGDWLNEIHPNVSGWEKLADVWQQDLDRVLA
ncbi:MAG: hypothetical protein EOO30_19735 [Comamonadaceae bacterium]|nr:MAG: hypothetical protein EOO30_19735 [Comamonadaceae bacterium]